MTTPEDRRRENRRDAGFAFLIVACAVVLLLGVASAILSLVGG